ncbi:MAG: hypothetical protein AB7F96_20200 [Beijerinckiaceae bacterium]
MQGIGRFIWVAIAVGIACTAAIVFLPVAIVSDPLLRQIGVALGPASIHAFIALFVTPEALAAFAGGALAVVWTLTIAICVAPVTLAAVIGETAAMRSIVWYVGASAVLAGAMPWILRAAWSLERQQDPLVRSAETRLSLVFLLTGALAGFVYWLAAGRNAGRSMRSR